jgi:RNA polymerase sigma-70 factor (ECF subfamily)
MGYEKPQINDAGVSFTEIVAEPLTTFASSSPTPEELRSWLLLSLSHLHKVARRMTKDSGEAADLVQATALRALENGHRFFGELPQFRRWLVTVMHNLRCDAARRQRAERLTPLPEELACPQADEPPVWRLIADDSVEDAVRQLPSELQRTYTLYAVDGLSYAAIGQKLNLPPITVGTRIHRARAQLRVALTKVKGQPNRPWAPSDLLTVRAA